MRDDKPKVEMAPTAGVDAHRAIARDFMRHIFGLDEGDYVISDESRMRDFVEAGPGDVRRATLAYLNGMVLAAYGVFIGPTENQKLVDIFDAISRRGVL